MPREWLQIKGDPSIREQVFAQTRTESLFDARYQDLMDRVDEMFRSCGIFHIMVHFSRSQLIVWKLEDPFNYRVLAGEEVFDPALLQKVQRSSYPDNAVVPAYRIRPLLDRLQELRFSDDMVYLRTGSINIMNGSVGLNFSCDGSHYIDAEEFLHSPLSEAV